MQSPNGTPRSAEAHVGLSRRKYDAMGGELALAPRPQETTAFIFVGCRIDNPDANNIASLEMHYDLIFSVRRLKV